MNRFRAELAATLREERIAKQLSETQQVSLRLEGPDEFRRFFDDQVRIWAAVVRENGIKAES